MEFFYSAIDYISAVFATLHDFLIGIPQFVLDCFTYAWYYIIKLYLSMKIATVKMAYDIANMLLCNYEVYTVLNSMFNNLSPNLRSASYTLGVVDAIRIVIDAMATAFVLRVMGW